jgi:hypothetical protein
VLSILANRKSRKVPSHILTLYLASNLRLLPLENVVVEWEAAKEGAIGCPLSQECGSVLDWKHP